MNHLSQCDRRVRRYLAPVRIVAGEKIENSAALISGRPVVQSFFAPPEAVCRIAAGGWVILDYGMELAGGVRLVSEGLASAIRIRFGESVSECCGEPDRDHAVHDFRLTLPNHGQNEFGNTGFRFVRIDALEETALLGVCAVSVMHDFAYVGEFRSSDPLLDEIWRVAARTVHLNCQDFLYDGIKRDRLVWMGDLHPEICTFLNVFDDLRILHESLDFVRDTSPFPVFMNHMSSYNLWWVISQHDLYWRTGDREYLAQQLETLREWARRFAAFIDGRGAETLPEGRFLDWPSKADPAATHAGLQALMLMAFQAAARIAGVLEDGRLAAFCSEQAARLRACVLPPTGRKAAAALLALAGAADPVRINREVLAVEPYRDLSTFLGFYVLRARALAGDVEPTLEVIRRYWGGMLKLGATSFWEDFDLDWLENASRIDELPQPGRGDVHAARGNYCYRGLRHSLCHGWAGGPAAFLSETLTGLEVLEPGCRKIRLKPCSGGLESFCCVIPTPQGKLRVSWENGRFSVDAPAGVIIEKCGC